MKIYIHYTLVKLYINKYFFFKNINNYYQKIKLHLIIKAKIQKYN
jgi:hypothetical protein